jgi:hypothetical protein
MARKVNPLTLVRALEKFIAAVDRGFKIESVTQHEGGARLVLTADAALVRATFPAARSEAAYTPGEQIIEGSAEIYDGETRLTLTVRGTETVPTVERVLTSTEDTDLHGLGVWPTESNRRLWNIARFAQVRAAVVVSDIPALRKLGVWVEPAADTVEATV